MNIPYLLLLFPSLTFLFFHHCHVVKKRCQERRERKKEKLKTHFLGKSNSGIFKEFFWSVLLKVLTLVISRE